MSSFGLLDDRNGGRQRALAGGLVMVGSLTAVWGRFIQALTTHGHQGILQLRKLHMAHANFDIGWSIYLSGIFVSLLCNEP